MDTGLYLSTILAIVLERVWLDSIQEESERGACFLDGCRQWFGKIDDAETW